MRRTYLVVLGFGNMSHFDWFKDLWKQRLGDGSSIMFWHGKVEVQAAFLGGRA